MVNLGRKTLKRTIRALKYGGFSSYRNIAGKAARYYIKSTVKITSNLFGKRVLGSQIVGVAYNGYKAIRGYTR